jgi:hypothetical protein
MPANIDRGMTESGANVRLRVDDFGPHRWSSYVFPLLARHRFRSESTRPSRSILGWWSRRPGDLSMEVRVLYLRSSTSGVRAVLSCSLTFTLGTLIAP